MAAPPMVITPEMSAVNLDAGGCDNGAPFVDATRPKPADGESVNPAAVTPNALATTVAEQWTADMTRILRQQIQQEDGANNLACEVDTVDMILAIRDLGNLETSSGDYDTTMTVATSVLGKSTGSLASVPFTDEQSGDNQNRGKMEVKTNMDGQQVQVEGKSMEATGLGAAGQLTGPSVAPCQET